jgi:hypothetical protein
MPDGSMSTHAIITAVQCALSPLLGEPGPDNCWSMDLEVRARTVVVRFCEGDSVVSSAPVPFMEVSAPSQAGLVARLAERFLHD